MFYCMTQQEIQRTLPQWGVAENDKLNKMLPAMIIWVQTLISHYEQINDRHATVKSQLQSVAQCAPFRCSVAS